MYITLIILKYFMIMAGSRVYMSTVSTSYGVYVILCIYYVY